MPKRPYAALPLLWAAVILLLTLLPAADMPPTPKWELLAFDTAAHAGVFGLLALLSWFALRRQRRWPWLAHYPGWPILIGCFLFGGLIEVLQTSMHMGRQGDVKDLIGDTLGAALALGLAWLLRHRLPAAAPRLLLAAAAFSACHPVMAQDVARARQTIEVLASEKMHGRGYVQQGEHLAAAYLRARLRELKLEPLAPDYTQPFALAVNTFPGTVEAVLHNPQRNQPKTTPLVVGQDFIVAAASGRQPRQKLRIFPLDSAWFSSVRDTASRPNGARPKPMTLQGKCLLLGQRQQAKIPGLPHQTRVWLASASAVVTVVPKLTASLSAVQDQRPQLEIAASSSVLAGLVPGTAADLVLQIDAQLQPNYQTQNLAAVIRGTAQPDSFLVISAHYDHLGMMGRSAYFPGANDNASGVALLLELAAHYARPENRPACSVVFLLFGAEEAGLVGSQYFVAHPLVPLARIKFLMNLDLLGTGEQGATVVNGRVFEPAYSRLAALNATRHYLPALAARGRAANSDHFPFSEAGVPAFFLYTRGGSTAYHDVNDRPAALSLVGFAGAFGLVRDFMDALGAGR